MSKKIKKSITKQDIRRKKIIMTVSAVSLVAMGSWSVISMIKSTEEIPKNNFTEVTTYEEIQSDVDTEYGSEYSTETNGFGGTGFSSSQMVVQENLDEEIPEEIMEDEGDEYVYDEEDEYEEDVYCEEYEEDEYYEEEYIEPEYEEADEDIVEEPTIEEKVEEVVATIPEPPVVEALSIFEEEPEEIPTETSENVIIEQTTDVNSQVATDADVITEEATEVVE